MDFATIAVAPGVSGCKHHPAAAAMTLVHCYPLYGCYPLYIGLHRRRPVGLGLPRFGGQVNTSAAAR